MVPVRVVGRRMGWLWGLFGVVFASGACTRPNAAFGADPSDGSEGVSAGPTEGEPTTGASEGADAGTTTSPDSDPSATTLPDPDATTATTADTTETGEPTGGSESGSVGSCEPQQDKPIEMEVRYGGVMVALPDDPVLCNGYAIAFGPGMLASDGVSIEHHPCVTCSCDTFEEPPNRIAFESFGAPLVPMCGRLHVWARFHPELGGCVWDGFAVQPADGDDAPLFVGANSPRITIPPLPELSLQLDSLETCANPLSCEPVTGIHAIGGDGQWVPPGGAGLVDLFGGLAYDVESRAAFIDAECTVHVSWTADQTGA